MVLVIEIPKQKIIEDGDYIAELKNVEEIQGKYGPMLRFVFDVIEPGYETRVTGICSKYVTPKSKLFRWLNALEADFSQPQIDLHSLIGKKCIITVSLAVGPDGMEYLNVVDVKRYNIRRPGVSTTSSTMSVSSVPGAVTYVQSSQQDQQQQQQQLSVQQAQFQQSQQPVQQQQVQQSVQPIQNPLHASRRNPLITEIEDLDELEF